MQIYCFGTISGDLIGRFNKLCFFFLPPAKQIFDLPLAKKKKTGEGEKVGRRKEIKKIKWIKNENKNGNRKKIRKENLKEKIKSGKEVFKSIML